MQASENFRPYGAVEKLMFCRDSEVLLEGPAGTGKTRGLLEYIWWCCTTFPGIRVLLIRKTRASLTESVLVTWEQKVLHTQEARGCITGTAQAENRRSYTFPLASNVVAGKRYAGESHIVLGGIDKASRIMSTEYDIIAVFEGNELLESDWEMLLSRNRNWRMPWQQAILDTNPDSDLHWINRRAAQKLVVPEELAEYLPPAREGQTQMTRLLSRHKDNPMLWDRVRRRWHPAGALYLNKLHALTGPRAGRLLRGEWVGAEGQIIAEFDREKHMVHKIALGDDGAAAKDGHRRAADGSLECDWYFGSVDWGHRAPGVLQIWGVVGRFERMYMLHEIYEPGMQIDWWAEQAVRFDKKYTLEAIACDPARPENIEAFNTRICDHRGGGMGHVAIKANNAKMAGWDMIRYGLDPGASARIDLPAGATKVDHEPKMFLCWDALESPNIALREARQATCTLEEVSGYVWKLHADGRPSQEENDPMAPDHGMDAWRYACMYAWYNDLSPEKSKPIFEPTSMGAVMEHDDITFDEEG